mmetsp:Transcript_4715/g.8557  ORF Transcript_4715/g.8557 Transcript_4715/m.8557 type:complete len:218 (+) Transcript_4715:91-744(+)
MILLYFNAHYLLHDAGTTIIPARIRISRSLFPRYLPKAEGSVLRCCIIILVAGFSNAWRMYGLDIQSWSVCLDTLLPEPSEVENSSESPLSTGLEIGADLLRIALFCFVIFLFLCCASSSSSSGTTLGMVFFVFSLMLFFLLLLSFLLLYPFCSFRPFSASLNPAVCCMKAWRNLSTFSSFWYFFNASRGLTENSWIALISMGSLIPFASVGFLVKC